MDKIICTVCGEPFVNDGKTICPECRVEVSAGDRKIIQALRRIATALEGTKPVELKPEVKVEAKVEPVAAKPAPKKAKE